MSIINGIDVSSLTDEQVLFFIRIRGRESYFKSVYSKKFLSLFSSLRKFRCISEYKKDADVRIDLTSVNRDWLTHDEYNELARTVNIDDVIQRCRGLRNISYTEARKLIYRAYLFFSSFYLQHTELRVIVMGAVDNYVMDMMQRIGLKHDIAFLGVTDSFMSPEYKLLSIRGELTKYLSPTEDEISKVYDTLRNRLISPSLPNKRRAVRSVAYDICSYIYRFTFRYIIMFKIRGDLAYEYRFAPHLHKCNSLEKVLSTRLLKAIKDVKVTATSKLAYIPLHYYPEATTDYWINDQYHVDYMTSLRDTIRLLRKLGYSPIIKEHPAFYMAREKTVYSNLIEDGAIVLEPFIATKDIFELIDVVVVWNGSTGIEALIHGKPVLKVTNSYYGDGIIPDLSEQLAHPLQPTVEIARNVIKTILSTSFKTT